jgi:hypothetical protein
MPRPKKIRKKKSFMFTSRHYSFIGTLSIVLAVCSLIGLFTAILLSSYNGGRNSGRYGGVGLFGAIANITGVIAGFVSLRERDIYTWVPKLAVALNLLDIIIWTLLILWGM